MNDIDNDIIRISEELDVPLKKLYMLSNNRIRYHKRNQKKCYSNYRKVIIHRGRGHKNRVLKVPNEYLKLVQRRILERYLYTLSVSEYATAYCKNSSLLKNAEPHIGQQRVLKLDVSGFFDSIDFGKVYGVMCELGFSKPATTLLTNICAHNSILPQGAPTSPQISNLVMKRFDERIGKWCGERGINYTRYCDDMTFSGGKAVLNAKEITQLVSRALWKMGFKLNMKKTTLIGSSQRQQVTGIVVNEKAQISSKQRREIRQEIYYCEKYGVSQSLFFKGADITPEKYINSLLGRISFALQIDPADVKMHEYFKVAKKLKSEVCGEK